jgi:ATP-dependent Clp endopeptidase proteolytic subunit ClpP
VNDTIELMSFSMRTTPPPKGTEWFRIVEAKMGSDVTKVYIYDEIGFWGTTAKDFAAALDEIETKEIHLHLNSPGGSVFDGLAIYNSLKSHDAKVTAIVDGMAASTASFILQAADTRQISRNAQVMIHDPKAFAGGNAAQMRQAADLLDRIGNEIADIYEKNSDAGVTAKDFRDKMKSGDNWYNGNEALAMGLVDEVTDNPDDDEAPEEAKNSWKAADVEAFLSTPPEKLAARATHLTTTNRVEEAQMGDKPGTTTATPPPAPQPPAPTAQATPPAPAAPAQPGTAQAAVQPFIVNGAEVTDPAAVQAHIQALETYRTESIENGRKTFVDQLAKDGKILASAIKDTSEFAVSLTSEQFDKWKATMVAAPSSSLFDPHGADTKQQTPQAQAAAQTAQRITVLKEIVQGHKDGGMPQDQLEKLDSYMELQRLEAAASETAS